MRLRLAENKNNKVKELKELNHIFQTTETGDESEYGKIEETMSLEAMNVISDWILGQV